MNDIGTIQTLAPQITVPCAVPQPGLSAHGKTVVSWAQHVDEVREAQHLRYAFFATETGAGLDFQLPGHDIDLFDNHCEHLLVHDAATLARVFHGSR